MYKLVDVGDNYHQSVRVKILDTSAFIMGLWLNSRGTRYISVALMVKRSFFIARALLGDIRAHCC